MLLQKGFIILCFVSATSRASEELGRKRAAEMCHNRPFVWG